MQTLRAKNFVICLMSYENNVRVILFYIKRSVQGLEKCNKTFYIKNSGIIFYYKKVVIEMANTNL